MVSGRRTRWRRIVSYIAAFFYCAMLIPALGMLGCEDANKGSRFELSGNITHGGKAIPKGYLLFAPDTKQGNRGPGSSASIIDGKYKTLIGRGTVGGPHVVTIVGTDGVPINLGEGIPPNLAGKPIFSEYKISIDLPKETSTYDFDVPSSHGSGDSENEKVSPTEEKEDDTTGEKVNEAATYFDFRTQAASAIRYSSGLSNL